MHVHNCNLPILTIDNSVKRNYNIFISECFCCDRFKLKEQFYVIQYQCIILDLKSKQHVLKKQMIFEYLALVYCHKLYCCSF